MKQHTTPQKAGGCKLRKHPQIPLYNPAVMSWGFQEGPQLGPIMPRSITQQSTAFKAFKDKNILPSFLLEARGENLTFGCL